MRIKQVATRLGRHENTIRNYDKQYGEFLSKGPEEGEYRNYTDDDLRVLAFISKLFDGGMHGEAVYEALRQKVEDGTPFPPLSPGPIKSTDNAVATLAKTEAQLAAANAELREMVGRLEELRRQNEARDKREQQYMDQIARLNQEVGQLKAQLEAERQKNQ